MTATHIRLTQSGRDEANALLLPIASTSFEILANFDVIAITAWGRVYAIEESLADIEDALSVALPVRYEMRRGLDRRIADLSESDYETLLAHLSEQIAARTDSVCRSEALKAASDALSNTCTDALTVREWLVAAGLRLGVDASRCV